MLAPWKKSYDNPRQYIKKQKHHFGDKGLSSQWYGFASSHVQMWELDHKESWVLKNWCFWTVVLEKTFESPFNSKEIKPVNPKGNRSWIFIGRTDAEAKTPIFGHLMPSTDSLEKTLMWGKIEGRRRRGRQRMRWLDGITNSMSLCKLQEMVMAHVNTIKLSLKMYNHKLVLLLTWDLKESGKKKTTKMRSTNTWDCGIFG